MGNSVNLPSWLKIPEKLAKDREILRYFEERDFIQFQLWKKTGGSQPLPAASESFVSSQQAQLNAISARLGTGDPLTWDDTGFTFDNTHLTWDRTEY